MHPSFQTVHFFSEEFDEMCRVLYHQAKILASVLIEINRIHPDQYRTTA
jgi:hypothetical protein